MRYLPHTESEIKEMLATIGVSNISDLFSTIPSSLQLKNLLDLPRALSEQELRDELHRLANKNTSSLHSSTFLGGGAYNHYVPSPISQLINRGEFFTSYTPYQPEVSQGTLQALFEYQTMICELTGMEVANASNYDVSTACAEAVLMAHRINKKKKALIAHSVNPQYRQVLHTYLDRFGYVLEEVNFESKSGALDLNLLSQKIDSEVSCVLVQSPNYFGVIEDLEKIGKLAKEKGILFIHAASEPLSLALLKTPGETGADISVLEGQSFGVGLQFGGPYLGIFATKQEYIRSMPGRIVGQTTDTEGKRGFVLTFSTREQHIRREKATSNICTNQGLCALMATIYLSLLGKEGLVKLAEINFSRAEYAKQKLAQISGVKILFSEPTFNEFVVQIPNASQVLEKLKAKNILGGILIEKKYPELKDSVLICITEMNSKESIDQLVKELSAIVR